MNQYRLTFVLLIGLITTTAFAQNKISGKLSDHETREVLPYATVRLLQQDSTFVAGTVTDSLGYYRINDIKNGDYLLYFSTIGYKPKVMQVSVRQDTNLPTVEMESDNVMLGEVVVKSSSFIRQKDKVLIIPDKEQVKHAGTGYDLLYNLMIPGIDVNRRTGAVSTLGGSVTLYINGEKAEFRDVQQLRPKDIEKVEYYDTPTGKYVRDVAAINYITKKYNMGGYVGVDGKQIIGYVGGDYNISTKLNKGNTTYTLFAGYNMKKYNGIQTEKQEEFTFPQSVIQRHGETNDAKIENNQQYIQFKTSHNTEKRTLSVLLGLIYDNIPTERNSDLLEYTGAYKQQQASTNHKTQNSLKPSFKLYGNFNLSEKQNLDLTAEGYYTRNKYDRTYTENEQHSSTNAEEDLYWLSFRGNYNIKLAHQNNAGVNFEHYHSVTSSTYTGDYDKWQHLWMGESMLFLYYQQKFGDKCLLNFSPGVSLLNYKLHEDELQRHWSLRLNINFNYFINENHVLMLIGAVGNEQADISYINSMDQTIDFLQIKRGNPDLANTKIYVPGIAYQAQLGKFNLNAAIMSWNYLDNITFDYYPEKDKIINSYRSDANYHSLTAKLAVSYRASDNLRIKINGEYANMRLTGAYKRKTTSFSGSMDINYFWKDFSLNVYGKTTSKSLNQLTLATLKNPAIYGLSLGWNHNNWIIEAGTENPFTKHNRYYSYADCNVYRFNQIQTSRIYQQTGYVKVAYTFDFGRKTSREQNDVDRNINSAILKVN